MVLELDVEGGGHLDDLRRREVVVGGMVVESARLGKEVRCVGDKVLGSEKDDRSLAEVGIVAGEIHNLAEEEELRSWVVLRKGSEAVEGELHIGVDEEGSFDLGEVHCNLHQNRRSSRCWTS